MSMHDALPVPSSKLRRSLCAVATACGVTCVLLGCSSGYDIPPPSADQLPQGDVDCMADNEPSQGDICTQDCLTATCASGLGRRICTCEGGVFLQCACLPPENWPFKTVPSAPYCDPLSGQPRYLSGETCSEGAECRSSEFPAQGCHCINGVWACGSSDEVSAGAPSCEAQGSGKQATLKDRPCDNEWQLCVARDFNPNGTSPRGCVCMMEGGQLSWTCGATNRWWRAE